MKTGAFHNASGQMLTLENLSFFCYKAWPWLMRREQMLQQGGSVIASELCVHLDRECHVPGIVKADLDWWLVIPSPQCAGGSIVCPWEVFAAEL